MVHELFIPLNLVVSEKKKTAKSFGNINERQISFTYH
jgi:hypothetical protein